MYITNMHVAEQIGMFYITLLYDFKGPENLFSHQLLILIDWFLHFLLKFG